MNQSSRLVLDSSYAELIGRCIYAWSYLEAGIVWLGEGKAPGFLELCRTKTSGQIASLFAQAVDQSDDRGLDDIAASFAAAVPQRDRLVHSIPYSEADGSQRLYHRGRHGLFGWGETDLMETLAHFEHLAVVANRLYHDGRQRNEASDAPASSSPLSAIR